MDERAGWFAWFVFPAPRGCCVTLPCDAVGLSAVYDCVFFLVILTNYFCKILLVQGQR